MEFFGEWAIIYPMFRFSLACALWLCAAVMPTFESSASSQREEADAQAQSRAFFAGAAGIPELRLELSPSAIESLNKNSHEFVKAKLREGTNVYAEVGVHLKG